MRPLPFDRFNEADVREEVIAPLLRQLGYQSGSANDVIREQYLRYPKLSIGRKKPQQDPELRAKADYILEVKRRLRWVIEAKAPEVEIGIEEIEQAWTYANHPEVRAVYFVLCNGRELTVYHSAYTPDAPAVLSLQYERLDTDFQVLANVLGPEALLRDFADTNLDVGLPIAPSLRSFSRITNGMIRYDQNSLGLAVIDELQVGIMEGAIERAADGKLIAFVKTHGPTRSLQELNERLGLSSFEMISDSPQLSTDPGHPTLFTYENRITFPAGERILDLSTWRQIQIPCNITCDVKAEAVGSFRCRIFSGSVTTDLHYVESGLTVRLSGSFEVHLT